MAQAEERAVAAEAAQGCRKADQVGRQEAEARAAAEAQTARQAERVGRVGGEGAAATRRKRIVRRAGSKTRWYRPNETSMSPSA